MMRTVLEKLSATKGYLENCPVEFVPGLNCIIGARGTCKSTLVESIRFAFDADSKRVSVLLGQSSRDENLIFASLHGMINKTLDGGTLRCDIRDVSGPMGCHYSVERDHDSVRRTYREGVKDHVESDGVERIEIYSQGDLQRIAEDDDLRLGLIDRPHADQIALLRSQQKEISVKLQGLGKQVRGLRSQTEQLKAQLRDLPVLRAQLVQARASRPELSHELEEERGRFQGRQNVLKGLVEAAEARDRAQGILLGLRSSLEAARSAVQQIETQKIGEEGEPARDAASRLASLLASMIAESENLVRFPEPALIDFLRRRFEELSEPYYQLRRQEQEANEALKREDALRQNIEVLETSEENLGIARTALKSAILDRTDLRRLFQSLGDQVVRLRLKEVESINEQHGGAVLLTLVAGAQGRAYSDKILRTLGGSRLHGQDGLAHDLAARLRPSELIDLVEASDTTGLTDVLGRDLSQVTRLISFLMDTPLLYELEGHIFEDRLEITMYDEGEPKPVEALSKGQKATALLPLILRPAPYPLIFDQPEDDLDNRFIYNSLVQAVRDLKSERQIIFVTHNANIPVIAEAENVVVMRMDSPFKTALPSCGSVDARKKDIIDLLEGGAEAFNERQRRYGELL